LSESRREYHWGKSSAEMRCPVRERLKEVCTVEGRIRITRGQGGNDE